ncbi:hypothetical protein [Cellulomonas soli]
MHLLRQRQPAFRRQAVRRGTSHPGLSQVSATELEPGVYFSIEASLTETHDDGTVTHSTVLAGVVREGNGWLIRAVQVDEVAAPDA